MNDNITFSIFEKSRKDRNLIGIYQLGEESTFYSGYVIDYDDAFVQIQHYTKYGKPDGVLLMKIEDITGLDYQDDYAKCLEYVIKHVKELDKQPSFEANLPNSDNWQHEILEQVLGRKDCIVRVSFEESASYVGFVDELDDEFVLLNYISTTGLDEGYSRYELSEIEDIRVNDLEARKRLMLYNWKNTKT